MVLLCMDGMSRVLRRTLFFLKSGYMNIKKKVDGIANTEEHKQNSGKRTKLKLKICTFYLITNDFLFLPRSVVFNFPNASVPHVVVTHPPPPSHKIIFVATW